MNDSVRYELDGHVATITYNRPEALNAVNGDMRRGLNDAFSRSVNDARFDSPVSESCVARSVNAT